MEPQQSFKTIKTLLNEIYASQSPAAEDIPLNISNDSNYDEVYDERINKFFSSYADVSRALQTRDQALIQAALMRAKIHTLSLTCFFTAFEDDCITLLSHYNDELSMRESHAAPYCDGREISA